MSVRPYVRPSVGPSVSVKEKRGLGASYVGYPTLFYLFFHFLSVSAHVKLTQALKVPEEETLDFYKGYSRVSKGLLSHSRPSYSPYP